MPYILDSQVTQDVENWMLQTISQAMRTPNAITFPALDVPRSVYRACHFGEIKYARVVFPEDCGSRNCFVEVEATALPHEEAIGSNIWLCPLFSIETVRKILERLEI